jgi:hypothetical protein
MDPLLEDQIRNSISDFQRAMVKRAREGWEVQTVTSVSTVGRVDRIADMAQRVDGPNVEIRAYATAVPMVPNTLIVANREAIVAVDHPRWERPQSALALRSADVVAWATEYFVQLLRHAPIAIRTPSEGFRPAGVDELRRRVQTRDFSA